MVSEALDRRLQEITFLGQAGALISGSMEYREALPAVARLTVPLFGDWCVFHVFEPGGTIERLQSTADGLAELDRLMQPQPSRPEIVDPFSPRIKSAMTAPLRGRHGTAGTILVASAKKVYEPADLHIIECLAHLCGPLVERTRQHRACAAARHKAEQANLAKDNFLAVLSHELRNPLMPVIGWARIFNNHDGIARDPVLHDGAQSLARNAENIARLVGDCLDLARISQGRMHIERDQTDLNKVVRASVDAVREAAWEKNLGLVMELSASSLWVSGDRTRLQQVLMNLLVNAIKFTESGGRISIRSSRYHSPSGSEEAEIEVADTGQGIESGHLDNIFEPFQQVDSNSSAGLGLGLAISRRIVDLHGGLIWAVSKGIGLGSVFRFRLPLLATGVDDEGLTPAPVQPATTQPLRILLVEDAKDILMLTKIQLEAMGHVVLLAQDGQKGLDQALHEKPDLIISDIKMPRADGYSLVRQIRAVPELASIPAIALTGLGMPGDAERAREAGFDACLVKPIETYELVRWIDRLSPKK